MSWAIISARLEASDRRTAAIHEAGHVVVGRHMGVKVFGAGIRRNIGHDSPLEKNWGGSTEFDRNAPIHSLALMGVAGMVAEAVWRREDLDDLIERTDEAACMSASDWKMVASYERQDFEGLVKEAYSLLNRDGGELWKPLLIEANGLMRIVGTALT